MMLISSAHVELRLAVQHLEMLAEQLLEQNAGDEHWAAHRAGMLITLVTALDRVEPGLGLRLLAAQVPGGRQMIEHLVMAPGYQPQPGRLQ